MKKHEYALPVAGAGALMTVFSVLCLVMLAMLSISTVQAQQKLSLASADAVRGHYEAEAQAEEILARLRCGELPEGVQRENGRYHYSCAISDGHLLTVEVDSESFAVLRWQSVVAAEWNSDGQLELWQGETEYFAENGGKTDE